jgi:drug/metabolite transporter (DMT)-like permease
MVELKKWYQSRAVWGGLVAVVCGVLGLLGYGLEEAERQLLTDALVALGSLIGGLMAIWGRLKASDKVE